MSMKFMKFPDSERANMPEGSYPISVGMPFLFPVSFRLPAQKLQEKSNYNAHLIKFLINCIEYSFRRSGKCFGRLPGNGSTT
ncbi:hypothetical protein D7Y09_05210 [bacterium 1XD42-1]|nr:hypothetical protein D7X25_23850 [bacterium 1XD42-8]RKJ65751.1 hypothetical protein D7Y09_05210 [bacterium 1XD42-1]